MTDEDKNLLELAAKAAGFPAGWVLQGWHPLTDDGDALRLMVHLEFWIYRGHDPIRGEFVEVFYRPRKYARQKSCIEYHKDHQDQFAATRRAIVRAAAEIGKAQQ